MSQRLRLWLSNWWLDYKIKSAQRNVVIENMTFRQARANEVEYQAQVQRLIKQRIVLNRRQHTPTVTRAQFDSK